MKLEFIDIPRAYHHAKALREVYIELPEGDEEDGMCGCRGSETQPRIGRQRILSYMLSLNFT